MQFPFSHIDWAYTGVLAVFVFVASIAADLLAFHQRALAALLAAVLFAVVFVVWTYYPHDFPFPTRLRPA